MHIFSFIPKGKYFPILWVNKKWKRIALSPELIGERKDLERFLKQALSEGESESSKKEEPLFEALQHATKISTECCDPLFFSVPCWNIFQKLTHLRINCCGFKDEDLLDLPESLVALAVQNCENFSGVKANFYPRSLKKLSVSYCQWSSEPVSMEGVLPDLLKLSLVDNPHHSPNSLKQLPSSLKALELTYQNYFNDETISQLPKTITELNLQGLCQLSGNNLKKLTTLKSLSVYDCDCFRRGHISTLPPSLISLSLYDIIDTDVPSLSRLTQLQYLSLTTKKTFSGICLNHLPASLKKLTITRLIIEDGSSHLSHLAKLTSLTYLSVNRVVNYCPLPFDQMPDSLQVLNVQNDFPFSGEELSQLSHCKQLETLKILSVKDFSAESINQLPINLKKLTLGSINWVLSESDFEGISCLSRLILLENFDIAVSSKSVTRNLISVLPRTIQDLSLYNWKELTDEDLAFLPPNLVRINFPNIYENPKVKSVLCKLYPYAKIEGWYRPAVDR